MKWFRWFVLVSGFILGAALISVVAIQNIADGPIGPIPGARFSSGTEVTGSVDGTQKSGKILNSKLKYFLHFGAHCRNQIYS